MTKFILCAALLAIATVVRADPGDERILAARDAASRGDLQRLATLAASPSDHVLEPYVQFWLLSARIARTSEPAPNDAVADFLRRHAGSQLAERLRMAWVKRLANEKRWAQFDAEYSQLLQPDQEAQCWAAQSGGSFANDALRGLDAAWMTQLDLPGSCDAPMQTLVSSGSKSADDVWYRFRRLAENKRFSQARDLLRLVPESQVPNPAVINAALDNPARFLASPAAQIPASRGAREAVLISIARLARTDVRDAANRWRALENSGFRSEERAYAWGQLAWMAAAAQMPEAGSWFAQANSTLLTDEQRAWRVRVPLRNSDWASVRAAIEAMPQEQRELPDWTYWLGRALQAQGRTAEAQRQFQRIADQPQFYGILATEALGRQYAWPKAAAPVTSQELARAQTAPELQRAIALYRLDMRVEGMREWNWVLRGADDRFLLAVAEFARRNGMYDRAINTAERTRNEHDFSLRYLAPYYDVFARQAQAQNLDLAWVYGLTRQESRFQPVVRSGAGAQGLMQIMPATGRWIARKQGFKDFDPSWLGRVEPNVTLGCAYLRHVLDLLSNNPVMASAAYNAGPGRPRRWRDSRTMEGAIFAETIPITETREYVKRVMANAEMYATLFDRRPVSLGTRLGRIPAVGVDAALAPDEP